MFALLGDESWTRADYLGLAGIAVSFFGFIIAVWQIGKTRKAAKAAEDAFLESGRSHFLFLLPQFRQLVVEFDLGVQVGDEYIVSRSLSSYASLANEVAAFIEDLGLSNDDAITDIRHAASVAADTKHEIIRNKSRKLVNSTADVQECMKIVSRHVAQIGAENRGGGSQKAERRKPWQRR